MSRNFPDQFLWGAASSGPQMEGAGSLNGKAQNVWDYWFEKEPETFYQQIGPEETSGFYHHYKEDIVLMKEIGFNSFRTSISWTRLIPDGLQVNEEAVSFYRDVFKELNDKGIKPIINLYHFDMPVRLHKQGGWENRETAEEFSRYAKIAFTRFGDLVDEWVTFNEPIVPIEMGYLNDKHLPAVYDLKRAFQAGFHTMLAHAKAVKAFKKSGHSGKIGIILNLMPSYPRSSDEKNDQDAAFYADLLFNRSFLDPAVKGAYPAELVEFMKQEGITLSFTGEDLEIIRANKIDFLGVNYYQPRRVQAGDPLGSGLDKYFQPYQWPEAKINPHRGWEIYEKGIYDIAITIRDHYSNIPWFIAENGMGVEGEERFEDEKGIIQDDYRIDFMSDHLGWLHKAIEERSNCYGYHVWTFIDNWSWLNEYKNRYGLVRLDLASGKRYKKKSADWFNALASSNQLTDKW
ncbi:glycoside hydrolase family 1 protein [Jeotgalibacillus proteolyticus]|uniref:6-phospho-beta-glucosidase n=1 Tax=Jeotgalibacillus proteolyticus TaxID=2082395 RepID=A0A2S5GC29_9BACL|nr:glycoside hydrolase family 1 protein [Jeotgalibacillus proteolyticus]PPA70471.1 6-phospho-beta-glucosidase [Jeotgalibacillus proteolyticus]